LEPWLLLLTWFQVPEAGIFLLSAAALGGLWYLFSLLKREDGTGRIWPLEPSVVAISVVSALRRLRQED
jgi:hypothetical protein